MSHGVVTGSTGDTAEYVRPNLNGGRGMTLGRDRSEEWIGSGPPAGPLEMQQISFLDLLDIVNPLQHVPVLAGIYRALTGDEIQPFARVLGGALFGGPVGFVGGIVEAILEEASGKDIGKHLAGLFDDADAQVATPGPAPANAPAAEDTIVGGVADNRLLGGGEPISSPPVPAASATYDVSTARVRAFVATAPGAPIDKPTPKWLIESAPIVTAAAAAFGARIEANAEASSRGDRAAANRDTDLPMIPTVSTAFNAPRATRALAAIAPGGTGRTAPRAPDSGVPAVVAQGGEPVYESPSQPPVSMASATSPAVAHASTAALSNELLAQMMRSNPLR